MKIAISSTGKDLDSKIDPKFGRCPYYIIVETDDMSFEALDNESVALELGAGVQSVQVLVSKGVKAVVTSTCGPNAERALSAANVRVLVGQTGTVQDAIERFKKEYPRWDAT